MVVAPQKVEFIAPNALVPYMRNARTHSEKQINKLVASIQEFGFTNPILIDRGNGIIAGHGRVLAARKLNIEKVPCLRLEHLTEAQKRAYILADNKLALDAEWDEELLKLELGELRGDFGFDLTLTGFDEKELNSLLLEDKVVQEDDFDFEKEVEQIKAPRTKPGDIYLLGKHRLMCGDSTRPEDVLRLMGGKRAVLFATDPPYLVDYDGTNHPHKWNATPKEAKRKNKDWSDTYGVNWDDSNQGPELYEAFIRVAKECAITENAAWYCWHASRNQAMVESVWTKMGAFVHQQIIWAKDRPILTRCFYMWQHEPCFYGWIKGKKPPRVSSDYPSTVWNVPTIKPGEKTEHPTSKPIELFALPMKQHLKAGEVCYEPFSGSGSQIMAAEQLGVCCYAMEVMPVYVDVAVKRWEDFTGKKAELAK